MLLKSNRDDEKTCLRETQPEKCFARTNLKELQTQSENGDVMAQSCLALALMMHGRQYDLHHILSQWFPKSYTDIGKTVFAGAETVAGEGVPTAPQ